MRSGPPREEEEEEEGGQEDFGAGFPSADGTVDFGTDAPVTGRRGRES